MGLELDINSLDDTKALKALQTIRLKINAARSGRDVIAFNAYKKSDEAYVGTAEIKLEQRLFGRIGSVAYEICEDQRGQGFATELLRALLAYAYNELGLVGIYGIAAETNLAAQYVLKRTGFIYNDDVKGALRFEAWNPRFQTAVG